MSLNKYMLMGMQADLEENVKNKKNDEIKNMCQAMIKYIDENTEKITDEPQCSSPTDLTQNIMEMIQYDKLDELKEMYLTTSIDNLKKWINFDILCKYLSDPIPKHRNATSYYLLSFMYGYGLGFEQSRKMEYYFKHLSERDFSYYKKYCDTSDMEALKIAAVSNKIPIAQRELAYRYLTGYKDLTQDLILSKYWFSQYAEYEPEDAAKGLAFIH